MYQRYHLRERRQRRLQRRLCGAEGEDAQDSTTFGISKGRTKGQMFWRCVLPLLAGMKGVPRMIFVNIGLILEALQSEILRAGAMVFC
jgi:hypothetical protein